MKTKSLFIVLAFSILFSGCSFEDIFSKLATTDVEAGAKEAFVQSKIAEAKQKTIEEKKQQFSEIAELKNVNDTTNFIAFAFRKIENKTTLIEVEATVANPATQFYEVWLRGENPKDIKSIGLLKFNQTDDYSLSMTTEEDLSKYQTIIISRDSNPDDLPETIVMTGSFTTK